ncbi:MAG: MerR family transcriptional regulator [Alistipes sp.]|nr:MerR family transcriptional regulator [Alistipes sp.]
MCAKPTGKIYYSMGEVTEMFDVNPSLIRFWESKFDILKPHKNKKGNRLFTPADIDNLKLIYHLVKEKGMTLAGAAQQIKANREGINQDMEVIDRLLSIKAILAEIKQELKVGADFDPAPEDDTAVSPEPTGQTGPVIEPVADERSDTSAEEQPATEDITPGMESSEESTGFIFINEQEVPAATATGGYIEDAEDGDKPDRDGNQQAAPDDGFSFFADELDIPTLSEEEEESAPWDEDTAQAAGTLPEREVQKIVAGNIAEIVGEELPQEYIGELSDEIAEEAATAAEVMEALQELDKSAPKGPQAIEQTLF